MLTCLPFFSFKLTYFPLLVPSFSPPNHRKSWVDISICVSTPIISSANNSWLSSASSGAWKCTSTSFSVSQCFLFLFNVTLALLYHLRVELELSTCSVVLYLKCKGGAQSGLAWLNSWAGKRDTKCPEQILTLWYLSRVRSCLLILANHLCRLSVLSCRAWGPWWLITVGNLKNLNFSAIPCSSTNNHFFGSLACTLALIVQCTTTIWRHAGGPGFDHAYRTGSIIVCERPRRHLRSGVLEHKWRASLKLHYFKMIDFNNQHSSY